MGSGAGSRFAERLLPEMATSQQRGRPLVNFLMAAGEAVPRGSLPPARLPAPRTG